MTKEQVDTMLCSYRECAGRCAHLENAIKDVDREIATAVMYLTDDMAALQAQRITDMPHGTGISNPTEQIAMLIVNGNEPDYLRSMRRERSNLMMELEDKQRVIRYVDGWLCGLSDRQSWVIRKHMIDGEVWNEVANLYEHEYGEHLSDRTLRRMMKAALSCIYSIAA